MKQGRNQGREATGKDPIHLSLHTNTKRNRGKNKTKQTHTQKRDGQLVHLRETEWEEQSSSASENLPQPTSLILNWKKQAPEDSVDKSQA